MCRPTFDENDNKHDMFGSEYLVSRGSTAYTRRSHSVELVQGQCRTLCANIKPRLHQRMVCALPHSCFDIFYTIIIYCGVNNGTKRTV